MNVLFTILTICVLVASLMVTLIVLLQNGKGGGLASNFVAGNQTFGVRQTADILEKITWGLVAFIFLVSVITTFTVGSGSKDMNFSDRAESEMTEEVAFPAPEAQNPAAEVAEPAADQAN
ncbi:MAG: preprotein translocase subunit SecG [Bacteroidales bacterium]|nr:preprotein translocase subunit SecG [Bacteroidales bacterium]